MTVVITGVLNFTLIIGQNCHVCFQSFTNLPEKPLLVDLTVEEGSRLKVIYGSNLGFHSIDLDSSQVSDIYIPSRVSTPYGFCRTLQSDRLLLWLQIEYWWIFYIYTALLSTVYTHFLITRLQSMVMSYQVDYNFWGNAGRLVCF